VNYTHSWTGLNYTTGMAAQIAQVPSNGGLYFWSGSDAGGPTYNMAYWGSTDGGTSWSIVTPPAGDWYSGPHITTFIDNGMEAFALDVYGNGLFALGEAVTNVSTFIDTGYDWDAPGASIDAHTTKGILTSQGVYFFTRNQVMRVLGPVQTPAPVRGEMLAGDPAERDHRYGGR
jgi:hypothetical protein